MSSSRDASDENLRGSQPIKTVGTREPINLGCNKEVIGLYCDRKDFDLDCDDDEEVVPKSKKRTRKEITEAPLGSWKFDQDKAREALCYMLIVDELPFKIVDNLGFRPFMSVACPMFTIPSQKTILEDIYELYMNEKAMLKSFIRNHSERICITTDTWTSVQKVNYMCLTAHFIDDDWVLQKRILNFCPISGHKSEEVGEGVIKCLLDWGVDKICTVTVDSASSNNGAIVYLQKKFDNWGTNIIGGKYVHMRCVAHIVNLIAQDVLKGKDVHLALSRIRGAIRYVRNSPARYKKFLECAYIERLETSKLLSLDVPTRWDSTYFMLESAIYHKRAFDAYADVDLAYVNDLSKQPFDGIPGDYDWEKAKLLLKFLGLFYKLTLCVSGSLNVTSNTTFHEISEVYMRLMQWLDSDDLELSEMSRKVKEKVDKYWGLIEKMNMILYYAVILDPRCKLHFVGFLFDILYGDDVESVMKEKVKHGMQELFHEYKLAYGTPGSPVSSSNSSSSVFSSSTCGSMQCVGGSKSDSRMIAGTCLTEKYKKYKSERNCERVNLELEKYLSEDIEDGDEQFDILKWWKVNSHRFPILSKIARDVLAVPVTTVASEAAFSNDVPVLDAFKSSLSPRILQALICAKNWLRKDFKPIHVEEDLSEIELIEKELTKLEVDSTFIDI